MEKYDKKYLIDRMTDFKEFRDGMIEAGYPEYVADRNTAIMLYSMWRR